LGRGGYSKSDMATMRRLRLVLSCFLAVLLAGGAVLPLPAVWQCRHAVLVVNAGFAAPPLAMPCRMGGRMPPMACCAPPQALVQRPSPAQQALSRAACRPVLTRLAALSTANTPESPLRLRVRLAFVHAVLPLSASLLPTVPRELSLRHRPPPAVGVSRSALEHAPGLRAPPVA